MLHGNQERSHHGQNASVLLGLTQSQKFDGHPLMACIEKVNRADFRDPFRLDPFCLHPAARHHGRENRYLAAGIMSFHIGPGIRFRISKLLSLPKYLIVICLRILSHPGQDIIGSAVQDTHDGLNLLRRKGAVHGADNRDSPSHTGFKHIVAALCCRNGHKFRPMGRHQFFVGSAYALSRLQGLPGELVRRANTAHGFAHNADLLILQDSLEIMHHPVLIGISGKIPQIKNIFDPYLFSGPPAHLAAAALNHFHNTAAHGPVSQHCYFYHRLSPLLSYPAASASSNASHPDFHSQAIAFHVPGGSFRPDLHFQP